MWLNDFKRALILKDVTTIEKLILTIPSFNSIDEIEETFYLLNAALELIESEKSSLLNTMQQIKNTLDFLKSTESTFPSSLNLKL